MLQTLFLTAVLAAGQPAVSKAASADAEEPKATVPVQRTAEPVASDGPVISVSGVVVTPDGKTIGGAVVILRAKAFSVYSMGLRHSRELLARTTTDAHGRFILDGIAIPPRMVDVINSLLRDKGGAELLSWADGRGIAWTDIKGLAGNQPVRLTLPPEAKVEGLVLDKTGRGLPDVRVSISGVTGAKADVDTSFLEPGNLRLFYCEASLKDVMTDAEGRFTLPHLPLDHRIMVAFERRGLTRRIVFIDTGEHKELTEIHDSNGRKETIPVRHSPVAITLEPQRFARVRIVDHAGQLVSDGCVQMVDSGRHSAGQGEVSGRGEACIAIAKPGRYQFIYAADPLFPRLGTSVTADIAAGEDTPVIEIRLREPRWLPGRVVDADTGKGIVGAYIGYVQSPALEGDWAHAVSGANGEFRIPVAPGRGSLGFMRPVFGYFAPTYGNRPPQEKEPPTLAIEVPRSGKLDAATLSIGRGLAIRGLVRDSDGKPVGGAVVLGQNEDSPYCKSEATTNMDGRFELSGLSPYTSAVLAIRGSAGMARMTIGATPDHPWDRTCWKDVETQLKPGIALTGRVLHKGQPRAGVVMKLFHTLGKKDRVFSLGESKTDAEGKYRLDGLEAGDRYYFEITDADGMADPAWAHQMPYMQTVPIGRPEIRLPDVQLITHGQALRGIVVDPQGMPVAGVTVSASLVGGRHLSRPLSGPPPWTKTDEQGRFELRQLPDQPIELMAYRTNPKDTHIKYPTTVRPALNQQTIRIVLDPALGEKDIEDLDAPKRPGATKK